MVRMMLDEHDGHDDHDADDADGAHGAHWRTALRKIDQPRELIKQGWPVFPNKSVVDLIRKKTV